MSFDDAMVSYELIYCLKCIIVLLNFVDDIVFIYQFNKLLIAICLVATSLSKEEHLYLMK
jgi:hypothetical protein